MKNLKYLCGILFLSFLLMIQITSCGGGNDAPGISFTPGTPFITSDLAGTWHIFATNGAISNDTTSGNIVQGNLRGMLSINSLGQVSGGSYARSNGGMASITGGLITIDNAGVLSGSATTNLGVSFYIGSGKMDSSKTLISFVASTNYGEFDFFTAIRDGGSFASSDLADTWYIFSTSGDYAKMTISDAGNGAAVNNSPGGGFLTIDASGLLTGDGFITTNFGTVLYLTNSGLEKGKINSSKDMMSFAASTISGKFDLAMAIRAGGSFIPSDLAGTWYIYGSSSSGANKATISGTIVLDSSGQVTGGSYIRSDAGMASFTGGTMTIDNTGVLSGSVITNIGDNVNLSSGKMNSSKGIMSFVATNGSELDFLICLKGS
jgi:hypothetical protein